MKYCLKSLVLGVFLSGIGAGSALAAAPTAVIQIRGLTPREIAEQALGSAARPTNGLPTVVAGYRVYLQAAAMTDYRTFTPVVSSDWTIEAVPGGSSLVVGALGTTDTLSFVPDVAGSYQVGLVVTDTLSQTSAKVLLWITAGRYVGVGTIGGSTPDFSQGQCGACHASKTSSWSGTLHAADSVEPINRAVPSEESCLACHATGWDKDNDVGGLAQTGFVFPDSANQHGTTYATNYDSIVALHPEQARYLNAQCEMCHGPGSQHISQLDKNQMSYSYSADVCKRCHDAPPHVSRGAEWNASSHNNQSRAFRNNRTTCARCHTAQGFEHEVVKGEPARTTSPAYENPAPITCTACHSPHKNEAPHQLRRGSVAEACTGCHTYRMGTTGVSLHVSHQGPMLFGEGGKEFPGFDYPNSSHTDIEERCVTCHMAPASSDVTATGFIGGHTFHVTAVDTSGAAPDTVLNSTGCEPCHGHVSMEFVELSQAKIHTLLDTLAALLPKGTSGTPLYSGTTITTVELMAGWNWQWVERDGSFGVHNHAYATALLKSSIAAVKASRAPGDIVAIEDVPNDQGGKVLVLWNAFADEINQVAPIVEYVVERLTDTTWVTVGTTPRVAGQSRYGLAVATLYDSTETGTVWSRFRVVGLSADRKASYAAAVDSGYSIDNLEPAVPQNLRIATGKLAWDAAPAADGVKYYAVFQAALGTTEFAASPYATTTAPTATIDGAYTYGVRAVDFAGNRSELAILNVPTAVTEGRPVPATTALLGNAPNPFNPSTVIRYQLHQSAKVTMVIYNVLGQPVRTLYTGVGAVGVHEIVWDGRDNTGHNASSGLYLAVMTTDKGFRAVNRMTLLR